jgi:hypothetical protein
VIAASASRRRRHEARKDLASTHLATRDSQPTHTRPTGAATVTIYFSDVVAIIALPPTKSGGWGIATRGDAHASSPIKAESKSSGMTRHGAPSVRQGAPTHLIGGVKRSVEGLLVLANVVTSTRQ